MNSIAFLIAICNLALLIYGIALRSQFHNGDECSMTYSVIRFLLLPPLKENNLPYRLFKFTDGRDERWDHLVDYDAPIGTDNRAHHIVDDENWCKPSNPSGKPGHIVLYIPGHEGSFMQARSIGAHGTLLTHRGREFPKKISPDKVLEEIWEGARHANAEYVDDFLFDVYTVDFNEEGAGLHGSRLFAQTDFVKSSIKRIANECDLEHGNITIVAHSMGGLVARKAIVELNKERIAHGKSTIVNTLVTLATPHAALSLIFEPSVFYFRNELLKQEEVYPDALSTVVSISGGLKDELINPSSCHMNRKTFYSVHSSNIIKHGSYDETKKQSQFGMDHNAIVWCHHVLRFVRNMIHAGQNQVSLKDAIFNNVKDASSCDYRCQCQDNEDSLVKKYGTLGAFVMKASMLYHARTMAILFTMNGIFYLFILWKFKSWTGGLRYIAIPLFASIVIRLFSISEDIDLYSNTLIAYNAMTIHSLILNVLYRLIPKVLKLIPIASKSRKYMKHQLKLIASLTIIGTAALLCFNRIKENVLIINETSIFSFAFIVIVIATFWNVIAMGFYGNELEKSLAAVVTVTYPLTAIGKIIYALSLFTIQGQAKSEPYDAFRQSQSKDSFVVTSFLLRFELLSYVVFVCLPLFILTMFCKCKEHGKPLFSKSKVMDKIK